MPKWKIHDKWAGQMGISKEVSDYVNRLVDFPEKCPDFLDFAANSANWSEFPSSWLHKANLKDLRSDPNIFCKLLHIGHDTGRSNEIATYIQLKFMRHKGNEYVKAWYLHHVLDYVEKVVSIFPPEEIWKRLEERTEPCYEFNTVKSFVRNHWEDILQDLGIW